MINFDDYTNENKIEHNPKRPYIPDHPHRIFTVGGSGLGKANALLIKYTYMQKIHIKQNINI